MTPLQKSKIVVILLAALIIILLAMLAFVPSDTFKKEPQTQSQPLP